MMANQHIELEDAGRRVEKSKRVLRTTTLNHFKKYLEFTNSDYQYIYILLEEGDGRLIGGYLKSIFLNGSKLEQNVPSFKIFQG